MKLTLDHKICYPEDPEYIHYKQRLVKSYQKKIDSAIIRSNSEWYKHEE